MAIEGETIYGVKVTKEGREMLDKIHQATGMSVPDIASDLLNGELASQRESYEALDRQQTRR